jgi:uncharacterized coiled-coil protein SlyX
VTHLTPAALEALAADLVRFALVTSAFVADAESFDGAVSCVLSALSDLPADQIIATVERCLADAHEAHRFLHRALNRMLGTGVEAGTRATAEGAPIRQDRPAEDCRTHSPNHYDISDKRLSESLRHVRHEMPNAPDDVIQGVAPPFCTEDQRDLPGLPGQDTSPPPAGLAPDLTAGQAGADQHPLLRQIHGLQDPTAPIPPTQTNKPAMPVRGELGYAAFQVWHNANASRTVTEWVVKIRSAHVSEALGDDEMLAVHYLAFLRGGPRRLREKITRLIDNGKLPDTELANFDRWSEVVAQGQPRDRLLALVSKSTLQRQQRKPGQSSRTRDAFPGQYAVLQLDPAGTAPVRLSLYLNSDQPIIIDRFARPTATVTGQPRKQRAAGWVAYYDPGGTCLAAKQDAKALSAHRREQRTLREFHPASAIGKLMEAYYVPLAEAVIDVKNRIAGERETQARLAALEREVASMPQLRGMPSKDLVDAMRDIQRLQHRMAAVEERLERMTEAAAATPLSPLQVRVAELRKNARS